MSVVREMSSDGEASYYVSCDWPGCGRSTKSRVRARKASDARFQARLWEWRSPDNTRTRRSRLPVDRCPPHREEAKTNQLLTGQTR